MKLIIIVVEKYNKKKSMKNKKRKNIKKLKSKFSTIITAA